MTEGIPQNRPENSEKLRPLIEEIRNLQEHFYIHGHGTQSVEIAESISEHGLYTAHGVLGAFTHTLPSGVEQIENELNFWNYDNRKAVVLIAVPKHPDYYDTFVAADGRNAAENEEISIAYAKRHIFKEGAPPSNMKTPANADKYIPTELIVGFWDAEKRVFQHNPRFSESAQRQSAN